MGIENVTLDCNWAIYARFPEELIKIQIHDPQAAREYGQCSSVAELTKQITVLDAVKYIHEAWTSIAEATITKCFAQAGVVVSESAACDIEENDGFVVPPEVLDQLDDEYEYFDNDLMICDDDNENEGTASGSQHEDYEQDDVQIETTEDPCLPAVTDREVQEYVRELQRYALEKAPYLLALFFSVPKKLELSIISRHASKKQAKITSYFAGEHQ